MFQLHGECGDRAMFSQELNLGLSDDIGNSAESKVSISAAANAGR